MKGGYQAGGGSGSSISHILRRNRSSQGNELANGRRGSVASMNQRNDSYINRRKSVSAMLHNGSASSQGQGSSRAGFGLRYANQGGT